MAEFLRAHDNCGVYDVIGTCDAEQGTDPQCGVVVEAREPRIGVSQESTQVGLPSPGAHNLRQGCRRHYETNVAVTGGPHDFLHLA